VQTLAGFEPPQVQPVPAIDARVRPAGAVSVTVTPPVVGAVPGEFATVRLYCAPCWPCVKLPVCVLVMVSCAVGAGVMTVESEAFAVAEPPPETLTVFT
jgi:hypothetical protein